MLYRFCSHTRSYWKKISGLLCELSSTLVIRTLFKTFIALPFANGWQTCSRRKTFRLSNSDSKHFGAIRLCHHTSKRHPLSKIVRLIRCILSRKSQNNLGRCRVEVGISSVDADAAFPLYVTLYRWGIWFLGPTQPPCTLNAILMTESAVFPQYMHVTTLFGQNSFISVSDSAEFLPWRPVGTSW